MSDNPPNPLEGLLSDFALGPAWARGKSDSSEKKIHHGKQREFKARGRDNRGDQGDARGSRNRRDDSSQGRGERRGNFDKGGRDGRARPDFQPYEEIAPAEGVSVSLFPTKQAIQLICKEIHQVARVYSLLDIAETILSQRERCTVMFERSKKKTPFYSCKLEEAIFLTKEEALSHFLQSDWRSQFIEESTVEVDPPKGSFQSVAKCGMSGEWLGPPNYHGYQTEIRRLHRERYSHMPFESYLAKVRTERSEEAVNAWLDSQKLQTRWRILGDEPAPDAAESKDVLPQPSAEASSVEVATAPAPEDTSAELENAGNLSEPVESDATPAEEASETTTEPEADSSSEPVEEETPEASEPQPEAPAEDNVKWFTDRSEIERAILNEVLEKAFEITPKVQVSAAISGKNLSPGLLVHLKGTGKHHRRHPAIVIPPICKLLEVEHMSVFKRKGKLYTGPTRPQPLAADAVLAPRPAEIVKWIRENTPAKLEGLWQAILPEGSTAPPAEYAADLFWLLQQGHILLYTDDTLVVQEVPKPQEPKKPKAAKKAAKKAPKKAAKKDKETSPQPSARPDEIAVPDAPAAEPSSEHATETAESSQASASDSPPPETPAASELQPSEPAPPAEPTKPSSTDH